MEHVCRCPQCGQPFKIDAKYAGRRVKCPKCGEVTIASGEPAAEERPGLAREVGEKSPGGAPRKIASSEPVVTRPRFQPPPDASMDDAVTAPDLSEIQHEHRLPTEESAGAAATRPAARLSRPTPPAAPRSIARPLPPASPGPSPSMPDASPADEGFTIKVDAGDRAPAASASRVKRKPSSPLALVICGGIGGLVLVVGTIVLVAWNWSRGSATVATSPATLVLDWPEAERSGSRITIDGKRREVAGKGPLEIPLEPGQHTLIVQRRGYEMIEFGFSLRAGEKFPFQPHWKALGFSSGDTGPLKGSRVDSPKGSTPPTVSGPAIGPTGFAGWLQSLEMAQRLAKQQRKDIFMVFAGSDWSRASMDMAEKLLSTAEFRQFADPRFLLVVIDLPRTEAGYNQLENSAQNRELVETFLIRQVPTVVLLDAEGRPYAIDGAFDDTVEKYIQHVNRMASFHGMRNDLFVAAGTPSLAAEQRLKKAHDAVTWLRENHLLRYYRPELTSWYQLASTVDAANEQGQLEVFFEANWLVRLANAVIERKSGPVKQQLAELLTWSRGHRFSDPDRGVRLHLAAFQLLAGMRDDTGAAEHVRLAESYTPRDASLQRELADARRAVADSNLLSSGTAFVVDASGYLLTNYHVVEGPGKTVVRLPGKQETVPAELIDRDEPRDMALLKVDPAAFGQLKPLGVSTASIKRAASVAVFGFPLGDDIGRDIRITTGVISALPDQSEERMLLLDCRVNPGNSGGPVIQRDGRVVGMITAKTSAGVGVDSYGMALPTSDLVAFVARKLPGFQPAASGAASGREWEQIDEDVTAGNSVLMVLKLRN